MLSFFLFFFLVRPVSSFLTERLLPSSLCLAQSLFLPLFHPRRRRAAALLQTPDSAVPVLRWLAGGRAGAPNPPPSSHPLAPLLGESSPSSGPCFCSFSRSLGGEGGFCGPSRARRALQPSDGQCCVQKLNSDAALKSAVAEAPSSMISLACLRAHVTDYASARLSRSASTRALTGWVAGRHPSRLVFPSRWRCCHGAGWRPGSGCWLP